MDLAGAMIFGIIIGMVMWHMVIKTIAKRNRDEFKSTVNKTLQDQVNGTATLDAISSEMDQLMKYHGEKIKINKIPFYSCLIGGQYVMLPRSCLFIDDSEKSDASL